MIEIRGSKTLGVCSGKSEEVRPDGGERLLPPVFRGERRPLGDRSPHVRLSARIREKVVPDRLHEGTVRARAFGLPLELAQEEREAPATLLRRRPVRGRWRLEECRTKERLLLGIVGKPAQASPLCEFNQHLARDGCRSQHVLAEVRRLGDRAPEGLGKLGATSVRVEDVDRCRALTKHASPRNDKPHLDHRRAVIEAVAAQRALD